MASFCKKDDQEEAGIGCEHYCFSEVFRAMLDSGAFSRIEMLDEEDVGAT